MKVAILAGGLGTRLPEETTLKPKPMVEVGEKPIHWHIMNIYASFGHKEFVVAQGYKGEIIKDYFLNYYYSRSLTVQLKTGDINIYGDEGEDWIVHLLDIGADTNAGGQVKRVAEFVGNEPFMLTYDDGVSNVNISRLIEFHKKQNKLVTMTAVRPPARFGQEVLILPQATLNSNPSWFGFPITIRADAPFTRNQLIQFLDSRKIATRLLFGSNLVRQPAHLNSRYRVASPLDNSDFVMNRFFCLVFTQVLRAPCLIM
jgi:hypothetical protein